MNLRNLSFRYLCYITSPLLIGQETQSDWNHQYHQKMYDYYNDELNQAEDLLQKAEGLTTMTGNWGGARRYLASHGVRISSSFVTDSVGNPVGGQARGFAYAGSFGVGLDIDFEKAAGWKGFGFYGSAVWRTGTSLSQRKINNQFPVQQVFGSQEVKLNELYFQKNAYNNLLTLKAGRLDAGNDFLASPLYAEFVSNAFDGNPVSIFNNIPSFSAYPNATWGAYLAIQPIDQLLLKFAVYNANTRIFANKYHGINFTFESTQGVLWITEAAVRINQKEGDQGLPGNYRAGLVYQTGNTTAFQSGPVQGNFCYYFLFDQMIYRPGGAGTTQGLTPFLTLLFTPASKNLFPFFCTAGLVYKGLISSRPRDTTNLGVAYGQFSKDLAAAEKAARTSGLIGPFGSRPQTYEAVLELNHWFQINDWFTFTPDIQYIFNPKGYGTIQNALVLGAQIGLIF
jgi:porin